MTYNPLDEELQAKNAHMKKAKQAAEYLAAEELWFTAFNREMETEKLIAAQALHSEHMKEHDHLKILLTHQRAKCSQIDGNLDTFNPFIRFSSKYDQMKERKLKEFSLLSLLEMQVKRSKDECGNAQGLAKAITDNIARYDSYQAALKGEERELSLQADRAAIEFARVYVKHKVIEEALQPKLDLIAKYEAELEKVASDLAYAESLQEKLNSSNSYERREIHQSCENFFGTGKPSSVIVKKKRVKKALERKLEKTQVVARRIGFTKSWVIKKLFIDGNNLCYFDEKFIGLKALLALIKTINGQYNIQIVFDHGILGLTELTAAEIKQRFPDNVEVHIAARGQIADHTLISLVNSDEQYFLISNDRFAEFADTPAVEEERVIRHELLSDTIFIHDLDLQATF